MNGEAMPSATRLRKKNSQSLKTHLKNTENRRKSVAMACSVHVEKKIIPVCSAKSYSRPSSRSENTCWPSTRRKSSARHATSTSDRYSLSRSASRITSTDSRTCARLVRYSFVVWSSTNQRCLDLRKRFPHQVPPSTSSRTSPYCESLRLRSLRVPNALQAVTSRPHSEVSRRRRRNSGRSDASKGRSKRKTGKQSVHFLCQGLLHHHLKERAPEGSALDGNCVQIM